MTADAMAPCVLWLDEIEKGVAAGEGDSGTSKRVLGTLLTWLAEKKAASLWSRPRTTTRPLSVVMEEQVDAFSAWASGREVPAD